MSGDINFPENQGPITIINEDLVRRPSILGHLVEIIATGSYDPLNLDRTPAAADVKIDFNNLTHFRWLIDEYIQNSLTIDGAVTSLNQLIPDGSTRLKRQMKRFYYAALAKYSIKTNPFDLEKLKINSDKVVAEVIDTTKRFVNASENLKDGYYIEDIEEGVQLIVSYCIIECIVLENPNDHS